MNLDKNLNHEITNTKNENNDLNLNKFDSRIDVFDFEDTKESFSFDFDKRMSFENDLFVCLEKFNEDYWEQCDGYEMYDLIVELSDLIADELGIQDKPIVLMYYEENPYDYGYASFGENIIGINCFNLDNSKEIVKVIAHEMRHFWQKERIELPEAEQTDFDKVLKINNENYVDPIDNYLAYWMQPMEIDCREYADKFLDRLNMEA